MLHADLKDYCNNTLPLVSFGLSGNSDCIDQQLDDEQLVCDGSSLSALCIFA